MPIYQRHYVWKREKQWEPFWKDVLTKAIDRLENRGNRFNHFMGSIVLDQQSRPSAREVPSYQVIDGQQRLTTLQLFLAATLDNAKQFELDDSADRIKEYLFNSQQKLMKNPDVEKFKVWPTKHDRNLFQDILTLSREELRKKYNQHYYKNRDQIYWYSTVPNLLSAYGFFYESIRQTIMTKDLDYEFAESTYKENSEKPKLEEITKEHARERLNAIWETLVEEFKVVEITLEDGDDAQVIFETLNERGEPLLAADLVRNHIFHRAINSGEDAEKLFSEYWKPFEGTFWSETERQGRYHKARIELFLAHFISGRIAHEVRLSKLFKEYKAFLRNVSNNTKTGYSKVEDEIKDLVNYGNIYRTMLERSEDNVLGFFTSKLYSWDITTVYPLVLRLWALDTLSGQDKKACLKLILSFVVRRGICNLPTRSYQGFSSL